MDDEELDEVKEKLENMEFNNDEEDLAEIEANLKNVEFNNEDEDQEILDDDDNFKKKISSYDDDSFAKDNHTIFYILIFIIILLVIIIGILVIPKLFKNSNNTNNGSVSDLETYEDEGKPTTTKIDIAKGSSSFINDSHLFVNYKDAGYITNLDGKVVYQDDDKVCSMLRDSYFMCERNSDSKTRYVIKKIDDTGNIVNVVEEVEYGSLDRVVRSGGKLVGFYNESNKGTHLAIAVNGTIKELDLDNYYILKTNDSLTKKIYGGRYVFVSNDKENNISSDKNYSYGVYDVLDDKLLIKPKYDTIVYLYDDLFVAVNNGKSGIINSNDDVKLSFKYDFIEYSNGLYFIGYNDALHVYDKNYNDIGDTLKVKSLSNYNYYASHKKIDVKAFSDKVILLKNSSMSDNNQYVVVDKDGKIKEYDFQLYTIVGDYIVTLKDKTLVLYDSQFNKVQAFKIPDSIKIDLDTAVIYLKDNLVFNGCYVFDINSGNYLYQMNNMSRSYQGYFINLNFQNGFGKADISFEDNYVGSIDDIDISEFLKADNNGIQLTNNYFIFHVGDKTLVLNR